MWHSIRRMFSLNDPGWGRGQGSGGGNDDDRRPRPKSGDGPPDLDELWRDFNRRLNGMFGGRRGGGPSPSGSSGGGSSSEGGPSFKGAGKGAGVLAVVAVLLWLASGFYIVPEGQAAAVLRFGEFKYVNDRAGFTWRVPYPVETHELVNVQQLRQIEVGYRGNVRNKSLREALMLTQDQSIVDMQYAVQYRLADPVAWLFNNNPGPAPEEMVRQAAETAMREIVGRRGIDQVLYEQKEAVATDARDLMQANLDRYKPGVTIVDVTIQQAQPPEEVQAAFEDANKAAQDRERLINEGRAYANDVIPRASGTAARLMQESEGYRERVVATAEGDASRFSQILVEYSKAPKVTRDRMYLETMQQVFSNTSKVYVDSRSGSNLLYLPLDKLMQQGAAGASDASRSAAPAAQTPAPAAAPAAAADASRAQEMRSRDRDAAR
ncbi:FtsH protease activity modulator HflK [Quisquiliibacterium transsilvanicum]|uniref:Protein HflK n=1 Tax=Quisquiliibacterium transsilvanicum TaxID=1549638 RepID=A0A7W8HDZ8_9BURK|nr:FtsH protease activity modulator HflK [Quisquiliibacterium transsilvanicum]MBB5270168.1 membrane protease subunit HflK [Quisquiliibacterium transsilvanicum]